MRSHRLPPLDEANAWARALAARRAAGARPLDLTESDPTRVGPSPEASQGRDDAGPEAYEPDPLGLPEARAAVSAYYAEKGARVGPDRVVLTSGTSEAYAHLFRLLADPGDVVLVPSPCYPLFEPLAALEGVAVGAYRLAWDGAWHLDRGSLERGLRTRPKAVVVVQPHVPTGAVLEASDATHLEAACAEAGAALIADEVFADYRWQEAASGSGLSWGRPHLALLERDVVVHPGDFYDLEGGAHVVVSLIPEPRRFDQGLARLEDLLHEDEVVSENSVRSSSRPRDAGGEAG